VRLSLLLGTPCLHAPVIIGYTYHILSQIENLSTPRAPSEELKVNLGLKGFSGKIKEIMAIPP